MRISLRVGWQIKGRWGQGMRCDGGAMAVGGGGGDEGGAAVWFPQVRQRRCRK